MTPSSTESDKPNGTVWRAYLLLVLAPLSWAGNIVLARGVVDVIPPVSLAFWRWTTAFMILLPFTWKHACKDWPTALRHWKSLVLLSFLGISCFNTLLYIAVHTTTAINAALIQTTMPAIIMVICLILYHERVGKPQIIGVSLCILGAGIVVLHGNWNTLLSLSLAKGDILMLVAVFLYALYSALLRKSPRIHPLSLLTYTFGLGALGLVPVYVLEVLRKGLFELTTPVGLSILYVAIFPSIVAFFCWNRGVALIGANRTGLFINLIPLFASIMAVVWLGESLRLFHFLGMTLLVSGMVMFHR